MTEDAQGDDRGLGSHHDVPLNRVIWAPAPDAWEHGRLGDFARHVGSAGGPRLTTYDGVLEWSLDQPGGFWRAVGDWAGVRFHSPPTAALGSNEMPGTRWFPGSTLNHAELALRQASLTPDQPAVVSVSQTRDRVELSWAELADQVAR